MSKNTFYKEFPSIKIPDFLKDWADTSWGNDVTASSEFSLLGNCSLVVWVNPDEVELREMWEDYKYIVILQDENRDEIQGRPTKTEEEAREAIRELLSLHAKHI